MMDIGLATAPRLQIGPSARQATVQMHLQFTGSPAEGALAMDAVFEACNRALASCDEDHAFIEWFWGMMPEPTKGGAYCEVAIGPVLSICVGDVQGGLLLGLAAATAKVAVAGHPMLSTLSAWFISPGRGESLSVRAEVLHTGRSFAVVRTQVRSGDDALVLEAVSNHSA